MERDWEGEGAGVRGGGGTGDFHLLYCYVFGTVLTKGNTRNAVRRGRGIRSRRGSKRRRRGEEGEKEEKEEEEEDEE